MAISPWKVPVRKFVKSKVREGQSSLVSEDGVMSVAMFADASEKASAYNHGWWEEEGGRRSGRREEKEVYSLIVKSSLQLPESPKTEESTGKFLSRHREQCCTHGRRCSRCLPQPMGR